jgi:hypothetical protein
MGFIAGLDAVRKGNISYHCWELNPNSMVIQPVTLISTKLSKFMTFKLVSGQLRSKARAVTDMLISLGTYQVQTDQNYNYI